MVPGTAALTVQIAFATREVRRRRVLQSWRQDSAKNLLQIQMPAKKQQRTWELRMTSTKRSYMRRVANGPKAAGSGKTNFGSTQETNTLDSAVGNAANQEVTASARDAPAFDALSVAP